MSNVDWTEINKFSNMASDWWDPNGPMKPLHQLNPIRLAYISQNASLKGSRIIDAGCGGGLLSEALAKAGAVVTGLDLSQEAIEVAKMHAFDQDLNISYKTKSIEEFALSNPEKFDIVTCMEMIEHVPSPISLVNSLSELVRPGGKVFISTLNRHPRAFLEAIVGAEYILKIIPRGTHTYKQFIRPSELEQIARNAKLSLQAISGFQYSILSDHFSLSTNVSVNYCACFEKMEQ